jgi:hypothetical protein
MAAGNYQDDVMFNVVLTSANNLPGIAAGAVPVLHVQPLHPLLVLGSSGLPKACTGFESGAPGAAAAGHRQLLGADAAVTQPARFRLSYSINGSESYEAGEFDYMATPVQRVVLGGLANYADVSGACVWW